MSTRVAKWTLCDIVNDGKGAWPAKFIHVIYLFLAHLDICHVVPSCQNVISLIQWKSGLDMFMQAVTYSQKQSNVAVMKIKKQAASCRHIHSLISSAFSFDDCAALFLLPMYIVMTPCFRHQSKALCHWVIGSTFVLAPYSFSLTWCIRLIVNMCSLSSKHKEADMCNFDSLFVACKIAYIFANRTVRNTWWYLLLYSFKQPFDWS